MKKPDFLGDVELENDYKVGYNILLKRGISRNDIEDADDYLVAGIGEIDRMDANAILESGEFDDDDDDDDDEDSQIISVVNKPLNLNE